MGYLRWQPDQNKVIWSVDCWPRYWRDRVSKEGMTLLQLQIKIAERKRCCSFRRFLNLPRCLSCHTRSRSLTHWFVCVFVFVTNSYPSTAIVFLSTALEACKQGNDDGNCSEVSKIWLLFEMVNGFKQTANTYSLWMVIHESFLVCFQRLRKVDSQEPD